MAKIPPNAFDQYLAMGGEHSYLELAKRLGVGKRSLVRHAKANRWQDRKARLEAQARAKADENAVEDISAINSRHLRSLRAIQAKALAALKALPLRNAAEAAKALDAAIARERTVLAADESGAGARLEDLVAQAGRRVRERLPITIEVVTGVPEPDVPYVRPLTPAEPGSPPLHNGNRS